MAALVAFIRLAFLAASLSVVDLVVGSAVWLEVLSTQAVMLIVASTVVNSGTNSGTNSGVNSFSMVVP